MNSTIKTWLYIIGSFLVVGILAFLALQLLFWAIPIILILYVFFKIKRYFKKDNKKNNEYINNEKTYERKSTSNYTESDVEGEVIDVDYQDVNKN